jgi:two-component system, chemotaxis family, protein-glutamate methylesterase/glutaminase
MSPHIIVIGTSLGGVSALKELFSLLSPEFSIPIAVVIHRGEIEFDYLINTLQKSSTLAVHEAVDKLPIAASSITIAPANYHLLIDKSQFALSIDHCVSHARPSIDVLMESAADSFGRFAVGIILTGGTPDGINGLKYIKDHGGDVYVQSPETAYDPALPKALIDAKIVDNGYTIAEIVDALKAYNG